MQLWQSQSSQCIFCTFRRAFRRVTCPENIRTFQQSTRCSRFAPAGLHSRRLRNGHPTRAADGPYRTQPLQLAPISLPLRVLDRLNALEQKLSKQNTAKETDDTSQDSIDPEGLYWDEFKKIAKSASERKEQSSWSPLARGIHQKLLAANESPEWKDSIGTTLHWSYLDFAISGGKGNAESPLQFHVDLRYPTEWYGAARAQQRDIHLHVGPTNSGKTYNALKKLEASRRGFYAGPLRLLAHEVYSRFRAKGIACDMITGDDVRLDEDPDVRMTSSTVEMVNVSKEVDVAVIDEIQMMASEDRGWAWTRAFLGANAKEVHLCGETRVVPLVKELAASMGDTLHLHRYERLNPLKAMYRSLRGDLKNLQKGDCVVSFSVVGIHALKRQIEADTGRRVAIVYGSLPPETRAQQAALFNDPDNDYDYLVASDAVGMGLNLAIKRVVFETTVRFNGLIRERLSVPHLKQIAGRAGRFRTAHDATSKKSTSPEEQGLPDKDKANVGLVTCLDEADLPFIQRAIKQEPPPIKTAGILPPAEYLEELAARLPKGLPFEYILQRVSDVATIHPRFRLCDLRDNLKIARYIDSVTGLSIGDRYVISSCPGNFSLQDGTSEKLLQSIAKCIADSKPVTVADLQEIPLENLEKPKSAERLYLKSLEDLHKALIAFLWLSYRFSNVLKDQDMAFHAKALTEEKINEVLLEKSHIANEKLSRRLRRIQGESGGDLRSVDTFRRQGHGRIPIRRHPSHLNQVHLPLENARVPQIVAIPG